MASLRVLEFDHEGRPVQFDTWLDNLQLYLLSNSKDSVSLFDLASGAATAPPATAESSTRSKWLTHDVAARLAIRNHVPLAECAHFGHHRTAQALYDAVFARYSSSATASLGRLLLPYLFLELSAFTTVEDHVSNLRASDARYRAAVPAEFLNRNPPPTYIALYFIVTRLPDSLPSVKDHFLSLDPTSLTVDLLEQHLLAAETSAVAVGAARGTPRPPFIEGCSPSTLCPSYASAAAADVSVPEDVGAASASVKRRSSKGKGGRGGGGGSGGGGGGSGSGGGGSSGGGGGGGTVGESGGSGGGGGGSGGSGDNGGGGTCSGGTGARCVGSRGGQRQQQQRRSETPSTQQLREWFLRGVSGGSCPYVIRTGDRAGKTCKWIHTQHRCFSRLDVAWRAEFGDDIELPRWADLLKSRIANFDLDFDAILSAMYALSVSAEGDCYRCVPPDPGIAVASLGASESGTLLGTAPAAALHTFTLDSGASRYWVTPPGNRSWPVPPLFYRVRQFCPPHCEVFTSPRSLRTWSGSRLLLVSPPVAPDSSVAPPSGSPLPASPSWHALLSSCLWPPQVSASPAALACPALPPCVEGRQRTAPHSSSFPPTTAPLQTLHMDVWGPARVSGQSRERYFMLVVDDYTWYTTVFHLRRKGEVVDILIPLIHTVRLQLRERFGQDLPVLRLHSDRGGEFSSNLLRNFCHGEGILHSFTLSDSPQQNGIAERRIGLVMEVARTSMIHAAAPHFLWPFAVRYAAHQFNLWPRVSLPETSPTLRWTREVGDASVFRFYHPTSRRVFPSEDVTFDESVPFYRLFPYRSAPPPPPPLFLAPDPLSGPAPVQVAVDSGGARGVASGGAEPGGAESEGAATGDAEPGGVETGGAESGGVATGGAEPEGVESGGAEPGGATSEGADSGGAEPQGASLSGGSAGALPRLSPQQLRECFVRRTRLRNGASGAGGAGAAGAGGPGVAARAGVTGGSATTGVLTESGTTGAGGAGAGGAGVGGPGVGGTGAGGAGAVDPERREHASHPVSPVRTACCVPHSRPPHVPGTHAMTLRPSSIPLRVPLPAPPESSLPKVPDRESYRTRTASPVASRLFATAVTDPSFESTAASALVAKLLDFAAVCRLDYTTALVAESASASPPSVGGECALGTDVLEERQEDFECLAAVVPRFASMLLAPEGDPDAPDIPTPRSYAEAITGPYSSQWQAAMDAEMASWKSTGTYVDKVPPPGANIVDGMWILRVKRPPGSPPAFKARYVARGFNQRQGVDYFQTFSPTPKMTTLRVLLHVAAQRDYELHSLDFSTAFLARELQQLVQLRLAYVATRANTADVFTKALPPGDHQRFVTVLGLLALLFLTGLAIVG
ncbi:unnamed protein product [Closterium sp. NIES-53]